MNSPGSNYKVLDFCGGQKPNLLVGMNNHLGATTRIRYASSTEFYLDDKRNGMPWHTALPFPVHVVAETQVVDQVSKSKLVSTYKYHHGYFDGREREFRGFARVDQFDTQFFERFSEVGLQDDAPELTESQRYFHLPPVETRTWFHTGTYFDADRTTTDPHSSDGRNASHHDLTDRLAAEFYAADSQAAFSLPDHRFAQSGGADEFDPTPHEAHRALRGLVPPHGDLWA